MIAGCPHRAGDRGRSSWGNTGESFGCFRLRIFNVFTSDLKEWNMGLVASFCSADVAYDAGNVVLSLGSILESIHRLSPAFISHVDSPFQPLGQEDREAARWGDPLLWDYPTDSKGSLFWGSTSYICISGWSCYVVFSNARISFSNTPIEHNNVIAGVVPLDKFDGAANVCSWCVASDFRDLTKHCTGLGLCICIYACLESPWLLHPCFDPINWSWNVNQGLGFNWHRLLRYTHMSYVISKKCAYTLCFKYTWLSSLFVICAKMWHLHVHIEY